MKHTESDYLDKLFASSLDEKREREIDIPQLDLPSDLNGRLKAIADQKIVDSSSASDARVFSFPKLAAIAATLFVGIFAFQLVQHHRTLQQLEQAQADLATALHYIGQANQIARSQVLNSLNDNIKRAGINPAVEIGRDTLRESLSPNSRSAQTQKDTHSL